jgi:hypothetical protein
MGQLHSSGGLIFMGDKTFRARIREETVHFPEIYADFFEDFKARSEEGLVENVWLLTYWMNNRTMMLGAH